MTREPGLIMSYNSHPEGTQTRPCKSQVTLFGFSHSMSHNAQHRQSVRPDWNLSPHCRRLGDSSRLCSVGVLSWKSPVSVTSVVLPSKVHSLSLVGKGSV